jgi:hypothetical protein
MRAAGSGANGPPMNGDRHADGYSVHPGTLTSRPRAVCPSEGLCEARSRVVLARDPPPLRYVGVPPASPLGRARTPEERMPRGTGLLLHPLRPNGIVALDDEAGFLRQDFRPVLQALGCSGGVDDERQPWRQVVKVDLLMGGAFEPG